MRPLIAVLSAAGAAAKTPKRKGGEVRRVHSLPKGKLARFIAGQVGPLRPAALATAAAARRRRTAP